MKRRGKWPPSANPADIPPGAKVERVWIWQESSDCLWKIAQEYYGNPHLWPKIYEANRRLIKDPNLIYPKQAIIIPPLDEAAPPARSAEELPGVPARNPGAATGGSSPAKER
jgi:hypothetical protein